MHRPVSYAPYPLSPVQHVSRRDLPPVQRGLKRGLDIVIAALLLLLLFPLLLLVALLIGLGSGSPVLFEQERIGLGEKPFLIFKFRSMVQNAEANGPQLSSANDPRITPLGRLLRKWRIDELPQLWNVLEGDMSLVGPRPERAFYRAAIISRFPAYRNVTQVRPGITSLGMVQCGYAENLDELVARARIEVRYINNRSLWKDGHILFQTIRIICLGKGK